ncbi:MAG: hypothetical protein L6R38_003364 [Xanthoria sp. 2 TBL-2021]|nr:MAG: hypothetical protein L6R38_003364 [Xanthoria sp. 2 TBL-2021]
MLLRAVGRSLRQCNPSLSRQILTPRLPPPSIVSEQSSGPLRVTTPYYQFRTYAKPPRPKKPYEYQSPSRHTPSSQQPGSQIPFPRPPNNTEGAPEYSKSQDEFGTRPESAFNDEPQSSGSGPGTTSASTSNTSNHPEYSKLQDEFDTGSSSDRNTAPQSTSPSAIDPAESQAQQQQTSKPLPDLTQGIPSTLEAELDQAQKTSQGNSQDLNVAETPADASSAGGRRGGGDLPKSANITSMERRRNRFANYMYATLLGLSIVGTVYLGRNWESEAEEAKHPNAPSGWGFGLFYNRASARLADMLDYYNEPAFAKLLPNPDPAWERPYTLVLSLEDLLVHSQWTREHGWRMAKRPGVDYFLRYLSQYYELVIFTSLPSMTGDPIIRKLDPYRVVMWPLFREATRYKNGEYIKDLDYLNRPLSRTILLDTHAPHASLQPSNAIILPKWKGSPTDTELVSYIPFLEYIASMGFTDVRDVLKSFSGTHIPSEYSKRESIAKERMQKQFAEENKKGKRKSSSGGRLLGAFGGGSGGLMGGEESLSEGFEKGKTYMDQVRERGQRQYEVLEKEIRENGEKWLKEMAAEEKKMQEEAMKGMQSKVFGGFFGGGGDGEKK